MTEPWIEGPDLELCRRPESAEKPNSRKPGKTKPSIEGPDLDFVEGLSGYQGLIFS